jgi:hypothetical protein
VSLVEDWRDAEQGLPDGWGEALVEVSVADAADAERTAALLGPLQPYRSGAGTSRFSVRADSVAPFLRLIGRVDAADVAASLRVVSSEAARVAPRPVEATLAASWQAALETLPPDWSDLYGEIDLISSDYIDQAALQLAPINPRRAPGTSALRFRCAAKFGYGASPGTVARCLERCDEKSIRGVVRILRALSETDAVGTQGPVWQIGGRTV